MTAPTDVSVVAAGVVVTGVPAPRDRPLIPGLQTADAVLLERVRALLQVARPSASWWLELASRLDDLADRVADHRAVVEGPDGLHAQLLADAPRLAPSIERLDRDHEDIQARLRTARAMVAAYSGDPRRAPVAITTVAEIVDRIDRHQRRGRDVVHEAYQVDLGGE